MDDDEIPCGMTRDEWSALTADERLALLAFSPPPPEVRERALEAYADWRAKRPT